MKNYIKILSLIMLFTLIFTACNTNENNNKENAIEASTEAEVESKEDEEPIEEIKDTVSISDEEFVEELKTIVGTTMYPKEAFQFFEEYYKDLDPEIASEGLSVILNNMENSISAVENDFFSAQLDLPMMDAYVYETFTVDVSKLDSASLSLYQDIVVKNGYRVHMSEGMAYPIIDYSYFKKYYDNLTDETKEIINILASDSDKPMFNDGGLVVSYEELVGKILNTEDFLNKYPGSLYFDTALSRMKKYAQAYMIGADNTPAFGYDDSKLNEDLKKSFEDFLSLYPKSKFRDYLSGYYDLIVENDYEPVRNYYTDEAIEVIYKSFDK